VGQSLLDDLRSWRWPRLPVKRALVLAGGGVTGGMFEVGALAALEESVPGFRANHFDIYVGSSAGSVVAALMATGVEPGELYRILDEGRDDPLNFHRGAVYHRGASAAAALNFAQMIWAVGRNVVTSFRLDWPDILARSQGQMPAGFYSVRQLEEFLRRAFAAKGLANDFRTCPRQLLIPALDLDGGQRAVFGVGELAEARISEAIAASSAIPGFFEPFHFHGRDYVDGDVGHTGHADLAVDAGAQVVVVVNPLVPIRARAGERTPLRGFGLYGILEQVGRINSQGLLELGLRELALRHPRVQCHLIEPPADGAALFGPSMGFQGSRTALQFGYTSAKEWVATSGAAIRRSFAPPRSGLKGFLESLRGSVGGGDERDAAPRQAPPSGPA
jgi:NTE family protein